ncbi:MAG: hypothetical protein KAS32_01895 [Candidatus Peribacteraceae bacterium]|nr:hypothetical protein [Candidatus Peribacteraceae bacterium]
MMMILQYGMMIALVWAIIVFLLGDKYTAEDYNRLDHVNPFYSLWVGILCGLHTDDGWKYLGVFLALLTLKGLLS